MKKLMFAGLLLLGSSLMLCAAEKKEKPVKKTEKELTLQFDRDGDGKLNADERHAMKESLAAEKEMEKTRIAEEKEAKKKEAAEARKAKKSKKK